MTSRQRRCPIEVADLHRTLSGRRRGSSATRPDRVVHDRPEVQSLFNHWFVQIVKDGTGKTFEPEHNRRWLEVTRPILDAFFHARYFLEMGVRYAKKLNSPPRTLPSGWAAFLYLYDLR